VGLAEPTSSGCTRRRYTPSDESDDAVIGVTQNAVRTLECSEPVYGTDCEPDGEAHVGGRRCSLRRARRRGASGVLVEPPGDVPRKPAFQTTRISQLTIAASSARRSSTTRSYSARLSL
jgi:hypothetical protein